MKQRKYMHVMKQIQQYGRHFAQYKEEHKLLVIKRIYYVNKHSEQC